MKRKLIYLLVAACCLGSYSSAKQVYKGASKECCDICRQAAKKKTIEKEKEKKSKAATIRPFNFYLFNI